MKGKVGVKVKNLVCLFLWVFGLLVYIEPVFALVPTVTSVTPDKGSLYSTTDTTIIGSNFEAGAKVSLINGGPVLAGTYSDTVYDVFVSGDYAYVAGISSELQVLDVSDPVNPTPVGSYPTPGTASRIFVEGDYAYVGEGSSGLTIINLNNSNSVTLPTSDFVNAVFVSENYAYVADRYSGLLIIDVSEPLNPIPVSNYGMSAFDVFV